MSAPGFLHGWIWLVKARIDGELHEASYYSKEQAIETARALAEDYGLSPEEVSVIGSDKMFVPVYAVGKYP
jgi:hypothetical protein